MARRLRLNSRDVAILGMLLERRAETLGYLHAAHFPRAKRKIARNRLGQLVRHGYLSRIPIHELEPHLRAPDDGEHEVSVYTLTNKGLTALRIRAADGDSLQGLELGAQLREPSVRHQLAVNRTGDILGTRLLAEHQIDHPAGEHRHRADAAWHAAPDHRGRTLVLLEIDNGNYTRQRILGKVDAFLAHPDARAAVFVCPDALRAKRVHRWIKEQHGDTHASRIQVLTLTELAHGGRLDPQLTPQGNPTAPLSAWEGLLAA